MCNGNCGKCKKAEDVKVESLAERSGMIVDDGLSNGDLCIAKSIFGNQALTFIGMADNLDYQNDCVVVKDGRPIPILYSELEKAW